MKPLFSFIVFLFYTLMLPAQKLVRYDLVVKDTLVNYTGKTKKAIAVNGTIPMPTLYFTEGDTAEIHVHNRMHHETSIHWHGLLLPNEQDGVPYLTTAPIKAHSSHIYKFKIRQNGTYWYHSHTMLQEQSGMYGAIVIHKPGEKVQNEEVVLLSDWSDENPHQIERSLHYATDWYMIKKNAVQSYGEALIKGHFKTKLISEWKRMHAMDVSDVYYDRFTVNGSEEISRPNYKAGDTIKLRVINGSSSTYFWLHYAGGPMRVTASDGADVLPVQSDRIIIGVSEIYDLEVVVPEDGHAFEFLATSEDRTGSTSVWLGGGIKTAHLKLPPLNYFAGMKMMNNMMTTGGRMHDMGMNMSLQEMDMNSVMYPEITGSKQGKNFHNKKSESDADQKIGRNRLNYTLLRSTVNTALPDTTWTTYHFKLTGNMNRYIWTVNNKTISESDKIKINSGENIRMIITNNSMMRHPMHLHGHYFRVINGQGDFAPLKNVIDIMPMETDTLEFNASEGYGDWYFHCHILYHMMSGMGRIFSYNNSPPNPQLPDPAKALKKVYSDDRRFYPGAEIGLESNGSDGNITLMNTRWKINTEWRIGWNDRNGYEAESHFGRYLGVNQYFFLYGGWDIRYRNHEETEKNIFNQSNTKNKRGVAHIGFQYLLPLLIETDVSVDHAGSFRVQLKREDIPFSKRLRLYGMVNSDREYSYGAKYILSKYLALSSHYDSDMGYGFGVTIIY